jgi:hypothetical protein
VAALGVQNGKKAGLSLAEIQKSMPLASTKAFAADGYGTLMAAGRDTVDMKPPVFEMMRLCFRSFASSMSRNLKV